MLNFAKVRFQLYCRFVVGGSYYGLTLAAGHMGTSIYLGTALSGLVELPAVLAIFYAIETHGRKLAVVSFLSLGGLFCLRLELRITLCFASKPYKGTKHF